MKPHEMTGEVTVVELLVMTFCFVICGFLIEEITQSPA